MSLTVLKRTYTLSVTIQDGDGEGSWKAATSTTGCDGVVEDVYRALQAAGFKSSQIRIHLDRFQHEHPLRTIP